MSNIKAGFKCFRVLFEGWLGSQKSWVILGISLLFGFYTYWPLTQIALFYKATIPPCTFAFYASRYMMKLMHGGLIIYLFSDLMVMDEYALWNMIRIGRKGFLIGHFLYIIAVSVVYTLILYLISIVMTCPVIRFTGDWGSFLWQLTSNSYEMAQNAGVTSLSIGMSQIVMGSMTPAAAVFYGLLYQILCMIFMGAVILCFNIWINRQAGIAAGGILVVMTLFVLFAGIVVFGRKIYWFSPVSWCSLDAMDWEMTGNRPSPGYAFCFYMLGTIVLFFLAGIRFTRKDLD